MREEEEEREEPKKTQKEKNGEFFHQSSHLPGENKTTITIEYFKKHKEKMPMYN